MRVFLLINFFLTYIIVLCASSSSEENIIPNNVMQNRICKTSGCIEAARRMMDNMDQTVQPCDNFYRFACGNYGKLEDTYDSVLSRLNSRLDTILKDSIEIKIHENDCRTLQLIKSHYLTCLIDEFLEEALHPSKNMLIDILNKLGGWPVLVGKSWNESTFDWKSLIYQLRRIGYEKARDSFLDFGIRVDEKNNTNVVMTLDQAKTGLQQEYLTKGIENEIVQAYYKYMVDIAVALGANRQKAKKELAGSLHFAIELAKISSSAEERKNMSQLYNPMTLDELQSKYAAISWKEYINELIRPHYILKSTDRIIVTDPKFLKSFGELISKTPKRVLANYGLWSVVEESVPFLGAKFQKLKSKLDSHITGLESDLDRWQQCITHIQDKIPLALGALYVRKNFDKNFKKEGEELVEYVRKSFKESLNKVQWMDEKTKKAALKKLKSLYSHVAYPEELLDDNKIDNYYENLKLDPDNYLDSYLSINVFEIDSDYNLLGKSFNKTWWLTHGSFSAIANAFYISTENSLMIPAGIFHDELFAINRPNYLNYGAMGYAIGHELTHAFDDHGSQYDYEGNLVNWWDLKTQIEYQKRTKCLVQQYNNYTVPEVNVHVNGRNSLGENIADNGGVKQAYLAYEEYEKRNGAEPRLPGLSYSPRQLFWLHSANFHCEKFPKESLEYLINSDEHPPGEFRVIGAFSNMPEFARDFECPLGSPMNPVKKCSVW